MGHYTFCWRHEGCHVDPDALNDRCAASESIQSYFGECPTFATETDWIDALCEVRLHGYWYPGSVHFLWAVADSMTSLTTSHLDNVLGMDSDAYPAYIFFYRNPKNGKTQLSGRFLPVHEDVALSFKEDGKAERLSHSSRSRTGPGVWRELLEGYGDVIAPARRAAFLDDPAVLSFTSKAELEAAAFCLSDFCVQQAFPKDPNDPETVRFLCAWGKALQHSGETECEIELEDAMSLRGRFFFDLTSEPPSLQFSYAPSDWHKLKLYRNGNARSFSTSNDPFAL